MTHPSWRYRCVRCQHSATGFHCQQPGCGALVEVVHGPFEDPAAHPEYETGALINTFVGRRQARLGPDASGVWRFRELILPGLSSAEIVTRLEGRTRLYQPRRLAAELGLESLSFKHEGENPTASFKDRGMTVGVTKAVLDGAKAVACASTGNTSASLAAYGAAAGLPVFVFIPEGKIARGKLVQTLAYGAHVLQVKGNFDDAMRLVEESCRAFELTLLNSINPWRIEGQKSIVFEIMDDLEWRAPDWIVCPAGNLGNTSAFGKALRELRALGLIDKMPRLLAVQAEGASPFARYFEARQRDKSVAIEPSAEPETVATAIRIGNPKSWEKAIREVEASEGLVMSVSDDEILQAKVQIDRAGIGCEPASAATLAGIKRLIAQSVIKPEHKIVAVLTGHILKDADTAWMAHAGDWGPSSLKNRPVAVEAEAESLFKVLEQHLS